MKEFLTRRTPLVSDWKAPCWDELSGGFQYRGIWCKYPYMSIWWVGHKFVIWYSRSWWAVENTRLIFQRCEAGNGNDREFSEHQESIVWLMSPIYYSVDGTQNRSVTIQKVHEINWSVRQGYSCWYDHFGQNVHRFIFFIRDTWTNDW